MHDGQAQVSARREHACGLADRVLEVVDVLERHEGDDEPERRIRERQRGRVRLVHLDLRRGLTRGGEQRR